MDKKADPNDGGEQTQKSSEKVTEATTPHTTSTTPTDDESITTTSTESESFEAWTLVTDKNKKTNSDNTLPNMTAATADIACDDEGQNDPNQAKPVEEESSKDEHDSTIDDYSDGISIISESESAGRVSPHSQPLREHLGSLNLNFGFVDDLDHITSLPKTPIDLSAAAFAEIEQNQPRERRRKRSSSSSEKARTLQRVTETATTGRRRHGPSVSESGTELLPIIRGGAAGIFYVCVALSLIAFIGRVTYPEWQPLGNAKELAALEQRVTDMELSNNLLRAEIDLLSKQVGHLKTLHPFKNSGAGGWRSAEIMMPQKERRAKPLKAWSGDSNIIEPVDVPIDAVRRPYRCPDGRFVEIAGMCYEDMANIPYAEQLRLAAEKKKEAEKMDAAAEKVTSEPDKNTPNGRSESEKKQTRKEVKYPKDQRRQSSKERDTDKQSFGKQQQRSDEKHRHVHDDHDNKSDYDNDDYDSDERYGGKPYFDFNSKEHQGKYHNSKERNDKEWHHTGSDSAEHSHKSGEWHEKLMQQREQARQRHEHQRHDKNWYIERGGSREQMRHR